MARRRVQQPRFLATIAQFCDQGEWFDAFTVACGLSPAPSLDLRKDASRRLANLSRFGHLERRPVDRPREESELRYEYRFSDPGRRQVTSYASWIPFGIG